MKYLCVTMIHITLTGSDVDRARLKIAGVPTKCRPPLSNLPWSLQKSLDDLKKREDIMVLPADKAMVMDELECLDSLLADRKFYKVLGNDPTPSIERKMNTGLKKNGTILEPLYCRLRWSHPFASWATKDT